jgi:SIR2-like domain
MNIVVLAGAGASVAVNREKYPTTIDFQQRLPTDISSSQLYKLIGQITTEQNDEPLDIEKILWRLGEVRDYLSLAQGSTTIARAISGNRLGSLVGQDTQNFVSAARVLSPVIDNLISEIQKVVYDLYSRSPEESELQTTWLPLLRGLNIGTNKVDLITTNYDLILESAALQLAREQDGKRQIFSGYTDGVQRTLDLNNWLLRRGERAGLMDVRSSLPLKAALITKLHGSVDWGLDANDVVVGGTYFKGDHSRHGILYPGYKGYPSAEPFQTLQKYFETVLLDADVLVVIGFAFRDSAINAAIQAAEQRISSVIVVDPTDNLILPSMYAGKVQHVKLGFGAESVAQVLASLPTPMPKAA